MLLVRGGRHVEQAHLLLERAEAAQTATARRRRPARPRRRARPARRRRRAAGALAPACGAAAAPPPSSGSVDGGPAADELLERRDARLRVAQPRGRVARAAPHGVGRHEGLVVDPRRGGAPRPAAAASPTLAAAAASAAARGARRPAPPPSPRALRDLLKHVRALSRRWCSLAPGRRVRELERGVRREREELLLQALRLAAQLVRTAVASRAAASAPASAAASAAAPSPRALSAPRSLTQLGDLLLQAHEPLRRRLARRGHRAARLARALKDLPHEHLRGRRAVVGEPAGGGRESGMRRRSRDRAVGLLARRALPTSNAADG